MAASIIGVLLGRRPQVTAPIGRLLADAKMATMLPEHRPAAVILNRLWPLLISTVAAGAIGFIFPQVPAVACGFAIIWSLAWRRQDSAVLAVEERDGVTFYVERTSPRAADAARAHAGPAARGADAHVGQRNALSAAVAEILIVSLGSTSGLRAADAELAGALERAGASVAVVAARPPREVRTLALTDLVWARAARAAAAARASPSTARAPSSTRR